MNKSINPETVLSTTRAECLRGMESANMDARMAWYYTHCGEIEMASFLGAITNDRMNDLEREWRSHPCSQVHCADYPLPLGKNIAVRTGFSRVLE